MESTSTHYYHLNNTHANYTYAIWKQRVADNETDYGYHEWVIEQLNEELEAKLEADSCVDCGKQVDRLGSRLCRNCADERSNDMLPGSGA